MKNYPACKDLNLIYLHALEICQYHCLLMVAVTTARSHDTNVGIPTSHLTRGKQSRFVRMLGKNEEHREPENNKIYTF